MSRDIFSQKPFIGADRYAFFHAEGSPFGRPGFERSFDEGTAPTGSRRTAVRAGRRTWRWNDCGPPRQRGAAQQSDGLAPGPKYIVHFIDWRRTISSNPEVTGQFDLPSSRVPRWKSSWTAFRAFTSRHRVLSAITGTIVLGLLSGVCRVLGEGVTEQVLTWISQR